MVPNPVRARARYASILTDACTITDDPGGYFNDTFNTTTGALTPSSVTTIYSGPCSIRTFAGDQPNPKEVGGQDLGRLRYRLTLPWDGTSGVKEGQVVAVTASSGTGLAGRTYTIRHVTQGSWEVSRRCDVEDRISAQRLE